MTVDYSLAEQIHATAKLKDVTSVKLWLGADVMLEYDLEEAQSVLVSSSIRLHCLTDEASLSSESPLIMSQGRCNAWTPTLLKCCLILKGFFEQTENLEVAEKSLGTNKRDLELMKDYATTTEVSRLLPLQKLPTLSFKPIFCDHNRQSFILRRSALPESTIMTLQSANMARSHQAPDKGLM